MFLFFLTKISLPLLWLICCAFLVVSTCTVNCLWRLPLKLPILYQLGSLKSQFFIWNYSSLGLVSKSKLRIIVMYHFLWANALPVSKMNGQNTNTVTKCRWPFSRCFAYACFGIMNLAVTLNNAPDYRPNGLLSDYRTIGLPY